MIEDDVQLIHRILSGDDAAFTELVRKHQESVHALAWRKIGDFHHAEEITQDTFLQVYKKLASLKDPRQFSGWLYVIANRLCLNWHRTKKSSPQSLETTNIEVLDKSAYSRYISQEQEAKASEHRYDIVKRLLQRLPESERTVITLYYLGEMTTREIGKFLGVSANTISSRLRRARKRLQQNETLLIQEMLGSVRLLADLAENITQKVIDIKPTAPIVSKPLLPWVALGAAALLFLVILGASNRYLVRFQKPYSFEAVSEPTIEIIDAPIVLETDAKPAVRNQIGRIGATGKNTNASLQLSQTASTSNASDSSRRFSATQWNQSIGPPSGYVFDVFATSDGTLYAFSPTGIYRLKPDAQAWTPLNNGIAIQGLRVPMAEHRNSLYLVSKDAVFTSTDNGETWSILCSRPKGDAVGFIISNSTQDLDTPESLTMYLALRDQGVFRSKNVGKQWVALNHGLTGKRVHTVAAIGNTLFAGTNDGLYRLNADIWEDSLVDALEAAQSFESEAFTDTYIGFYYRNAGVWEQIPTETSNAIYALKVSGNNLYVAVGPDLSRPKSSESNEDVLFIGGGARPGWIFRSTDFGDSWTDITPKGEFPFFPGMLGVKLLVAGNTLFAQGAEVFRSTDTGETWTNVSMADMNLDEHRTFQGVTVDERTFYTVGKHGVYRTTDAGDSWHPFTDGIVGTGVQHLITYNNRFYVLTDRDLAQSTDGGESWNSLHIDAGELTLTSVEKRRGHIDFSVEGRLVVGDGTIYGISPGKGTLRIFRLSADGNALTPVQGVPTFDENALSDELITAIAKAERLHPSDDMHTDKGVMRLLRHIAIHVSVGGFAVSDGTFYVEYQRSLFKWKRGDPDWTNTGLIDLGERTRLGPENGFKLAASRETVYVGRRDGKLFQSLDSGNSWKNITSSLPLYFNRFKEIVFAGSTVYIATDTGVLSSQTGEHWRVLTDRMGKRPVIDRFAVNGATVYGAGDMTVYRLDIRDRWEQITHNIPDKIVSLSVHNNMLYVATQKHGILHIPLPEDAYSTAAYQ